MTYREPPTEPDYVRQGMDEKSSVPCGLTEVEETIWAAYVEEDVLADPEPENWPEWLMKAALAADALADLRAQSERAKLEAFLLSDEARQIEALDAIRARWQANYAARDFHGTPINSADRALYEVSDRLRSSLATPDGRCPICAAPDPSERNGCSDAFHGPASPVLGDEEREQLWTIADQIEAAVKERKIPDEANRDARYLRNLSGLGDQLRADLAQGEERDG